MPVVRLITNTLLLKSSFAVRALRDAAYSVRDALEAGDLARARASLSSLCSRNPDGLDAAEVAAAAVESVAENASDSIVAPLFYWACFGVPGAVFYRAVNTLDAMIGYHGRLEYAGKAAARLDDLLNFVPSRLTAALFLASGLVLRADVGQGLWTWRRDAGLTESPNAGHPMAAMAGLLGVRLEKKGHYALGDARRPIVPAHITRAGEIVSFASLAAAALGVCSTVVRS
jgi:adenosylcobinamide-phosphate synthase